MNTLASPHWHRNRFLLCLALSLFLHTLLLTLFYFNPLILQQASSLFGLSAATPTPLDIDIEDEKGSSQQKNAMLEEAFQKIIVLPPHLQQPYDRVELPKGAPLAPNDEFVSFEPSWHMEKIDIPDQRPTLAPLTLFQEREDSPFPPLFSPPEITTPLASQLQIDATPSIAEIPLSSIPVAGPGQYEDLISMSELSLEAEFEVDYTLNLSPQLMSLQSLKKDEDLQFKTEIKPLSAEVTMRDLHLDNESVRSTLFIPKSSWGFSEKREIAVFSPPSRLEEYEFPSMAMAAEWNDDFDAHVTFLPNPEGKGYIFSVTLKPHADMSSYSLKQNIYFIIDRSNSIQKHRFAVFKRGVLKALSSMQRHHAFNIFIIDKKIIRFSQANIPVTMKNIQAAEEFLAKQESGGLFSAGEIYTSLEKILISIPEDEEIHTAIFLTDGKSDWSAERKQKAVKKWMETNHARLSLYTAAIGRENDLIALDLLSFVSGGKLLYSDTHASFPRKLAKLILDLKDPVAKDLIISAIPHNPHSHIEFYTIHSHLPALYSDQPYVIIGQIDEPCAFDLVIQGRHKDQWIAIKKEISFMDGHKGDQQLLTQWSAEQAHVCYAKFLKEGKVSHLKEAKEILKKSRFEIAFE